MTSRFLIYLAAATLFAPGFIAKGAQTASDNAGDLAYASGWVTGANGGSGFEAWNISLDSGGGDVLASSSVNGANPPSGNIDSNGVAWGLYSTNDNFVTADRRLIGNLSVGQQVLADLDTGTLGSGGLVEFNLQSGTTNRFEFIANAFENGDYEMEEKVPSENIYTSYTTNIPFTSNGLHLDFTLTTADTFSLAVTPAGGLTNTFMGDLTGVSGSGINNIDFLVDGAGSPPNADAFLNNIAVVPEPAGTGIILVAGGLLLVRFRKRLCC